MPMVSDRYVKSPNSPQIKGAPSYALSLPSKDGSVIAINRPSGRNGFDIVIGNPPYIKEGENKAAFNGFRENSPYYCGKMDLWYGFACHSLDLLNSKGILSFIAINNWTTNAGGKVMRNKLLQDVQIMSLIDFNDYMVFGGSASVQTMIMLFKKSIQPTVYSFEYKKLRKAKVTKSEIYAFLFDDGFQPAERIPATINRVSLKNKVFTFSAL